MPQKIPAFSPSNFIRTDALQSFRFEGSYGNFTARRETRKGVSSHYWFAYKKVDGKLRKLYLGLPQDLTLERLEQMSKDINQDEQSYYSSRPRSRSNSSDLPSFTRGGRGLTAPYETITIRIPKDLYDDVTEASAKYKVAIAQGKRVTSLAELLAQEPPSEVEQEGFLSWLDNLKNRILTPRR